MPTGKNQNQGANQNIGQNELQNTERVDVTGVGSKKDCCDQILEQLRAGVPVILTAQGAGVAAQGAEEVQFFAKLIRDLTLDFCEYKLVMDDILNTIPDEKERLLRQEEYKDQNSDPNNPEIFRIRKLSLVDQERLMPGSLLSTTHAYQLLRYATEKFVQLFYGQGDFSKFPNGTLPYLRLVESKLECLDFRTDNEAKARLSFPSFRPVFLELIWSYWLEEGMVSHTMRAIARRFQNIRAGNRDPLANMEITPLRPLNNLLWGYIQDTVNRLTPVRIASECCHEYGIVPSTTTIPPPADCRVYFIQSFHNLLNKCAQFYKEADNLIKVADALPVLNALRDVHMQLAEAAHNQFLDLPLTARVEGLLEQYLLGRREMREFLGGRAMVPNDPAWLDIVDTMKTLQGWNRASTLYFYDLATFGEQIILSIRWIAWMKVNSREVARAWALEFRDAIERYINCYQAITNVDLSAINVSSGVANDRALMPAIVIQRNRQRGMNLMRRY